MISRIHSKLGTAGFVIAIIALVAAMTGGAYAALSNADKKLVKKEAKKFSKQFSKQFAQPGPAGPKGDTGATGPAGKDGTNGTNGTNGTDGEDGAAGKSVVIGTPTAGECANGGATVQKEGDAASKKAICNGQTGFTDVLPPGKTLKGHWSFGTAAANQTNIGVPISFGITYPNPAGPTLNYVRMEETTANCTGSFENPTALPGNLCVYEGIVLPEQDEEETGDYDFNLNLGFTNAFGGTDAAGVNLIFSNEIEEEEAKPVLATGAWAVTAPTS